MAVTVQQAQYLVLDADFRIVEVGPSARATFGPLLGELIYDAFPECEPLFRPYYERARRIGGTVEFGTYYDGYAMHLRVTPQGSNLLVTWDTLAHLDVLTLDGLMASLDAVLAALSERELALEHRRRRAGLRVVGEG